MLRLAPIKSMLTPEAEKWLLGEPPWNRRLKEMSNQLLLKTIVMFSTEVNRKFTTGLSIKKPPSNLQRTTKRSLYRVIRCWTLLVLHGVCPPVLGDSLLQLDEGPVLQGDGHQADDVDLLAGPAALLCITYLQVRICIVLAW